MRAYRDERETFEETLRRLSYERIIPREVADLFHALRKVGQRRRARGKGNHSDALTSLKFARQLGDLVSPHLRQAAGLQSRAVRPAA